MFYHNIGFLYLITQLQNAEVGQAAPSDRSSHLLTRSKVNGKENENVVATTGATLAGSTLKKLQNNLKVWVVMLYNNL